MTKLNKAATGEGKSNASRVELRSVKYAAFASQETNCFNAVVFIDGKKEGTVENDGHGGSNMYHPWALQEKLNQIGATMPEIVFGEEPNVHRMAVDADILVGDILNAWIEKRDLKRHCSKKTLFRLTNETYNQGEWRTVKSPFSPQVKAYLQNKYGVTLGAILNETI